MNTTAQKGGSAEGLRGILNRYQSTLVDIAAPLAKQLRAGLSPAQLEQQVREHSRPGLSFQLPLEYFPLFEQFNGQKNTKSWLIPSIAGSKSGFWLGSIQYVIDWHSNSAGEIYALKGLHGYADADIAAEVRSDFWNSSWIPFARGEYQLNGEGCGLLLILDLDPSPAGSAGQIILETCESKNWRLHLKRRVVAPSLAELFGTVTQGMIEGAVIYDAQVGLRRTA